MSIFKYDTTAEPAPLNNPSFTGTVTAENFVGPGTGITGIPVDVAADIATKTLPPTLGSTKIKANTAYPSLADLTVNNLTANKLNRLGYVARNDWNPSYVHHSTDLITWSGGIDNYNPYIIFAYNKFISVRINESSVSTGTNRQSTDGITWTDFTLPSGVNQINGLAFLNNNLFVYGFDYSNGLLSSTDGTTWTIINVPKNEYGFINSRSMSYANGRYVVLDEGRGVAHSTDLVTWTYATVPPIGQWYGVLTNGTSFVIYNNNNTSGTTLRSTDGITWTEVTVPILSTVYLNDGLGAAGNYVLTSQNERNRVFVSTDGLTWGARPIVGSVNMQPNTLTYANNQYILSCYGDMVTSTDAITWTSRGGTNQAYSEVTYGEVYTPLFSNSNLQLLGTLTAGSSTGTSGQVLKSTGSGVQWGNPEALTPTALLGVRVATPVQARQSFIASNNITPLYTSPSGFDTAIDAVSFTNLNASAASVKLYLTNKNTSVQKFVGTNQTTSTAAMYSTDGITWITTTMPASSGWSTSLVYGNGLFFSTGGYSTRAAISTDAVTWSLRTMPAVTAYGQAMIVNGTILAPAYQSTTLYASTDAITWTTRTLASATTLSSSIYANGIYLLLPNNSTTAQTSTDGITWSVRTLPAANGNYQYVAYGNGVFVVTDTNNASRALTSTDAITWTIRTLPTANQNNGLAYGNGVFFASQAIFNTTSGATSTDGITWVLRTLPYFNAGPVTYGNGLFVALSSGSNTSAATSTDGITWTLRTVPVTNNFSKVISGGHMQDSEIIYKNGALAANGTAWIDANKYDPIFVPAGYSLVAQSSVSPVNVQISGERWVNA